MSSPISITSSEQHSDLRQAAESEAEGFVEEDNDDEMEASQSVLDTTSENKLFEGHSPSQIQMREYHNNGKLKAQMSQDIADQYEILLRKRFDITESELFKMITHKKYRHYMCVFKGHPSKAEVKAVITYAYTTKVKNQ